MKNTKKRLQQVENAIIVITFSIMVVACFAQVVNRNFFKIPVSGFEEAAKYCMIYMVMLGTEMGLRDGTQIAVTAVVDSMKGKTQLVFQVIAKVIVIAFSAFLFAESFRMVLQQIEIGQTSPGLHIPMSVPYAALPIGFGIIVLVQIGILVGMIQNSRKADETEGGAQA